MPWVLPDLADTRSGMQSFYGGSLTVVDSEVRACMLLGLLQGQVSRLLLLRNSWLAADQPQF